MQSAAAFLVKYAGLTAILLVLSVGVTTLTGMPMAAGATLFASVAVSGYFVLARMENGYSLYGVERARLNAGRDVLLAKVYADRDIRLAELDVESDRLAVTDAANKLHAERLQRRIDAQMARHEVTQDAANRQNSYYPRWLAQPSTPTVEPLPEVEERAILRVDDAARRRLLEWLADVYATDADGSFVNMYADGRIRRDYGVPLSSRSGVGAGERKQMQGILDELRRCGAWLVRYDKEQRLYEVNLELYPNAADAIDAVNNAPTPRL